MGSPSPLVRKSNGLPVKDGSYAALGFRSITGAASVVALSAVSGGIPNYANKAFAFSEGGTVRWRDDGDADPGAGVGTGMPIFDQCGEWLMSDDFSKVKFFVPVGVTVSISFYA